MCAVVTKQRNKYVNTQNFHLLGLFFQPAVVITKMSDGYLALSSGNTASAQQWCQVPRLWGARRWMRRRPRGRPSAGTAPPRTAPSPGQCCCLRGNSMGILGLNYTGWHICLVKTSCWLGFGMFRHPAWAVGSYSSGPAAASAVRTKSTGGFLYPEWSPCTNSFISSVLVNCNGPMY